MTETDEFEVRVEGARNVVAVGGSTATVTYNGFDAAAVKDLLSIAGAQQQARIDELGRSLNISRDALHGFFHLLERREVGEANLPQALIEIAQRHKELLERQSALEPDSESAKVAVEKARELLQEARSVTAYEKADGLLGQAESSEMLELQEAEELLKKAQVAADRRRHNAAELRAQRGRLSMVRMDYLASAEHFRAADALVQNETDPRKRYFDGHAAALALYGEKNADNASLAKALEGFRSIAEQLQGEQWKVERARMLTNISTVLLMGGVPDLKTKQLEDAVQAGRDAVATLDRVANREDWSSASGQLGLALGELGKRLDKREILQEAVDTMKAVLENAREDQKKADRAQWLNNLGNVLNLLGLHEEGTARLQDAVQAEREALELVGTENQRLRWEIQVNLCVTLAEIGSRDQAVSVQEEALALAREVLTESSKEHVPLLEWATAQGNLAALLFLFGKQQKNDGRLEEAKEAARVALTECTRERFALRWAQYQALVGEICLHLALWRKDIQLYEEGKAAYAEAEAVYTLKTHPDIWLKLESKRADAAAKLGYWTRNEALLQESIDTCRGYMTTLPDHGPAHVMEAAQARLDDYLLGLKQVRAGEAPPTVDAQHPT